MLPFLFVHTASNAINALHASLSSRRVAAGD